MSRDRAALAIVRNPVLALPAARGILAAPPEARGLLAALLRDLAADCRERAAKSWRTHKAPMALYWKCCAVYAGHLARAIARPPT